MVFEERLGHGRDGVVFKVSIDGTPYALKVFWDVEIPRERTYYAIQKECWNFALLQMIGAAIAQSEEPIYLKPDIESRKDALYNTQAFCSEAFQNPSSKISLALCPSPLFHDSENASAGSKSTALVFTGEWALLTLVLAVIAIL
ncbi:unnamed protein product [Clonostachys chloroleuca]|uniref:Uncharacterized protein n=1 Tax=Clonostachys chloroleuca TaxID=1926264 RepID=A0AA35VAP0_9HYPO|nr:unnamed protein product [Clonostachys chloroleuca]